MKLIQSWLSFHWQKKYEPLSCVYGYVAERSHIEAAERHLGARWVLSLDIKDFFPSVRVERVRAALIQLGYTSEDSLDILGHLCCFEERLTQGAPTSPVLSNIVLSRLDRNLLEVSRSHSVVYTRFADDIVFSGMADPPTKLTDEVVAAISDDGWNVAKEKASLAISPERRKVHGLLVHGEKIRLTKGYRNRIRAYRHLLSRGRICEGDLATVKGHIAFADHVDRRGNTTKGDQ